MRRRRRDRARLASATVSVFNTGYDQDDDDFIEEALSPSKKVSAEWVVQHLRRFKRWYVVERLGSDGNVCKYEPPPPPPLEILNRPHPPLPPRREVNASQRYGL